MSSETTHPGLKLTREQIALLRGEVDELGRLESKFLELQGMVVKNVADNDRWLGNHEKAHPSWQQFMTISLGLVTVVAGALVAVDVRAANSLTAAIAVAAKQSANLADELKQLRLQVENVDKAHDGRLDEAFARLPKKGAR